ncbi:MAG: hypothetical protein Q9196_004444 [Gyalolechia fulgens]
MARTSQNFPSREHAGVSRMASPDLDPFSPSVLRLRFDSINVPTAQGFEFGSGPRSDVKIPNYGFESDKVYFRIHFNFDSGALLITALDRIKVGSTRLQAEQSLLLMFGVTIGCGAKFGIGFIVEFPDTSNCADEHERQYQRHASKIGVKDAQYLPTPRAEWPLIGAEHRSIGDLGQGGFGMVHKALQIKNGKMFAIKVLNGAGEDEMKEVNLMSKLSHENIIKYEHAFRTTSGQTCIVMELAVNDLHKQLKARQHGKARSYLSLECIRSIGRQALSALEYLHREGFMHRDLKPGNILVTKWDLRTDIPTVKLADFGLAGTRPKHDTDCGTYGYIAPEIYEIRKRREELEKDKGKGMETVASSGLPTYTNAVDIWAMGRVLQELLDEVPSHVARRGKSFPVVKEPALSLIRAMLQDDPSSRPTAADCLKHRWMSEASNRSLAQKRDRSLGPSSPKSYPDAEQPLRKVIRKAFEDSTSAVEGSPLMTRKDIWQGEQPKGRQPFDEARPTMVFPWSGSTGNGYTDAAFPANVGLAQGTYLDIQREGSGLVSFNIHGPSGAVERSVLVSRDNPQASPSLEDVIRRMLAGLQEAGYGKGITVAGRSTSMGVVGQQLSQVNIWRVQLQPNTAESMQLRVDFGNALPTSSIGSQPQPAVNLDAGFQPRDSAHRSTFAAAGNRPRGPTSVQINFSQLPENEHPSRARSTSAGSNSNESSAAKQGVTFPSDLNDEMADISF